MTDRWQITRPLKWLDHSQVEATGRAKNDAKVTVYVNLRGHVDTGSVELVFGQVVIRASGPIAFTVEQWREFVQTVEQAISLDEQYQKQLRAISELPILEGESMPTAEQLMQLLGLTK